MSLVRTLDIDDGIGAFRVKELAPSYWELQEPFSYVTDQGKTISISKGFLTDGASAPVHLFIRPWAGHYSTAALVHDFLCAQIKYGSPDPAAPTRADADAVFFEIMGKSGVNIATKWLMWLAVRLAGLVWTR